MLHNLKKYSAVMLSIMMLSAISFLGFALQAQAEGHKDSGRAQAQSGNRGGTQSVNRAPSTRQRTTHAVSRGSATQQQSFTDSRYNHNRSYPSRGQAFRSIPRDHKIAVHDHSRYYSANGVWYHHHGGRYEVIAPPVGLFIPFLPLFYTTLWFNGMPYYYANETYYTQTDGGYVVVQPPQDELSETPPVVDQNMEDRLFIYPRKGQSEEQQARDRYECHQWSVKQTNYDPTQIQPSIPADKIMQARMDYNRAMTACLDARGYTAK